MERVNFLRKSIDLRNWRSILKKINNLSNTQGKNLLNEVLKDKGFKLLAKDLGIKSKSAPTTALHMLFVRLNEEIKVKIVSIVTNYLEQYYDKRTHIKTTGDEVRLKNWKKNFKRFASEWRN